MTFATILIILPAGCGAGPESRCTDSEVHKTVNELVADRELGAEGARLLPDVFSVRSDSATYVSTDKQAGTVRCSIVVTKDLLPLMSYGQSAEDIEKLKAEASKKKISLTSEALVHFTVQELASGQFYISIMQ